MKKKKAKRCTRLYMLMKISLTQFIVLVVFGVTAVASGTSAQELLARSVTLNAEKTELKDILSLLEKQVDVKFAYSQKTIRANRRVSLNVNGKSLSETLNLLLNPLDISYQVLSGRILLTLKPLKKEHSPPDDRVEVQGDATPPAREINGTVTDESGTGLPGVNVIIKGTRQGTVTDAQGRYTLATPDNDAILIFSFVGYISQEVTIGTRNTIEVVLQADQKALDEVVVVGYGTQTRREISGSITRVTEKEFNKGVMRNAVDLLEGRVAGLTITRGSGDITRDQTIRLRGTSSLTGSSQPFIVIDGVPGVSINTIAPQDIESISILKDASAAAIYGSRSASGVILITTKKGARDKTEVIYDGYVAIDKVVNVPDVLDASAWREYAGSNNIKTDGLDLGADTNWFREIMRTGFSQNHSLSLSGGGKNNWYRASVSSLTQQGVVKKNDMQRYNARLAFSQKALDDRLNITLAGAVTERNFSPTDTRNFVLAYNMLPVVPVKHQDGSWFDSYEYDQGNPVRNIAYNKLDTKNSSYYLNLKADLSITDDLVAGLNVLKQRESNDYAEYNNSQTERGRNQQGYARRDSWTADKKLLEATLNYKRASDNQSLNILAGYSYEHNYLQQYGAQNRQFVTDYFGYNNLGAGENLFPSDVWSGANMNKLISTFARINYLLLDRYAVTASVRRDGSSKFGKNHKWGTFPSLSVSWALKDESFLRDVRDIDELKLRVGYGVAGNQDGLDPYKSLQLYGQSGLYYDNERWYKAYQISQNANPDLKWEKTATFNVGLDFSLFNSRLNGVIEYYNKKTSDLLFSYQVSVPPYLYPDMIANVGSMSNKGVELSLNADIVRNNDFRWNASVNMARNRNKILRLSNEEFSTNSIKTGSVSVRGGTYNTSHIIEEGREVGTFYGWKYLELDENGKYVLDDMVDGKPGISDEDRTYIGSAQPKLTYGVTNTFNYRQFELSFFLRGVAGNDVLNLSRLSYGTKQWLPGANVLRTALTNGISDNPQYSSYYIEKGTFVRLDNVTFSYNIKTGGLRGIERLRLYLTGQNLILITGYTGVDPEVEMGGTAPGTENRDYYPKSRSFSLGVNLTF